MDSNKTGSNLNLPLLESKLDNALEKETTESLTNWLNNKRNNMNKTKRITMVSIGALLTFIVMLWFNIKVFPFGDTSLEVWTSVIVSLGITYLLWAPINKYYGDF